MNIRHPETQDALARAYVLGTLHGGARRRFERWLHADFRLQRAVSAWQARLYPLTDGLPEQRPPGRVWRALRRRLKAQRRAQRPRLGFWRGWSALATAATLVLALYVAFDRLYLPPPGTVSVVADAQQQEAWLVQTLRDGRLRVLALQEQSLPPDRSFELWLLPGEGQPPRSLGLIPAQGEARIQLSLELARQLPQGAGMAVSLEPAGGSPTGAPTGPVLYQGGLVPPPA